MRAPVRLRSNPVSGSRYGSTPSAKAVACASAGYKLVGIDASHDVLFGVSPRPWVHVQTFHLAAVLGLLKRDATGALSKSVRCLNRVRHAHSLTQLALAQFTDDG